MNYSPLRYPGGKTKIAPFVEEVMNNAKIIGGTYIEPFAGGCGVALSLLLNKKVKRIVINDVDKAIYSFWYALLNQTKELIKLIEITPITIEEWKKQRKIFLAKDVEDILSLGFATFFLNRTNRSGILKAGPIGGYAQTGNYLIDARFNKENLIKKIIKISEHKDRIVLFNKEINEFIVDVLPMYSENSFVYFDPPYFVKGHELYTNFFTPKDHEKIAAIIKNLAIDWMVTYDNAPEVKELYFGKEQRIYDLNYSLANKGRKTERIILSRDLWPNENRSKQLKIDIRRG